MDPNLTLAHITHNTSMILLHQHLAYPPAAWGDIMKLPSSCSAKTCQLAAVETSSIAVKYLRYTDGILTSQFAFCAFVAARIFLVHFLFYRTSLAPEFESLIKCLEKMSERWQGSQIDNSKKQYRDVSRGDMDMAARYASQLRELHGKCQDDPKFYMKILGYVEMHERSIDPLCRLSPFSRTDVVSSRPVPIATPEPLRSSFMSSYATPTPQNSTFYQQRMMMNSNAASIPNLSPVASASIIHLSPPTSALSGQPQYFAQQVPKISPPIITLPANNMRDNRNSNDSAGGLMDMGSRDDGLQDELSVMSQLLLGQQFLEMDRVITLEGTDFDFNANTWGTFS